MTTNFEKCVELAQERLRQVITAANKADPEEMRALMCSSITNELPTKSNWCDNNSRLVIDKYEFTIEEFIQYDARTTDRYCLFGPMPNRDLSDEEYEQVQEELLGQTQVLHWQFGGYTDNALACLEKKARNYLIDKGLLLLK